MDEVEELRRTLERALRDNREMADNLRECQSRLSEDVYLRRARREMLAMLRRVHESVDLLGDQLLDYSALDAIYDMRNEIATLIENAEGM